MCASIEHFFKQYIKGVKRAITTTKCKDLIEKTIKVSIVNFCLLVPLLFASFNGLADQTNQDESCEILACEGSVFRQLAVTNNWEPAFPQQLLSIGNKLRTGTESRATVRFSDLSVVRINELTVFSLLPPPALGKKPLLDLKSGSVYFFSREKPTTIQFKTPTASGAIRGTEFQLEVTEDDETILSLIDGIVDLGNDAGTIRIFSGEQAHVTKQGPPTRTALIEAINVIQWCLYYPAVIDVDELQFDPGEVERLGKSIAGYRSGDLLGALESFPRNFKFTSEASVIFRAELALSVGDISLADGMLNSIKSQSKSAAAIRKMIAAVQYKTWQWTDQPTSSSEWLAHSYYCQSQARLSDALEAAHQSVSKSPSFGFAWIRVAELEFSLGKLDAARLSLERGLQLSPLNAQGIAAKGFMLASENQIAEAVGFFDRAIQLDGSLANAWLGRGLCRIRQQQELEGRKDLQVAAALEPQRALLRSYLAKAYYHVGLNQLAEKELLLAKHLDTNDPTAWLYSALLKYENNRINESIQDLETSKRLNSNQSIFRSKLLLDRDQAVRSANLAQIYNNAGMPDLALQEASLALCDDYANYSAHLFLADSYDKMRDPKGYNLRYETPAASERFVANLLSPAGSEVLSQNIASREYSPLFVTDGFGLTSSTEYDSSGTWSESASQYGREGRIAYAIDTIYRTDKGQRINNDLEQREISAKTKIQISEHDSVYFQAESFESDAGDMVQYYDNNAGRKDFRVSESHSPNIYVGEHHQWQPGSDTLFFAGRLNRQLNFIDPSMSPLFLYNSNGKIRWFNPPTFPFAQSYERSTDIYSTELQHVWRASSQTIITGGRLQAGDVQCNSYLAAPYVVTNQQTIDANMGRISLYAYDQWQVADPLNVTIGGNYDHLNYPINLSYSPLTSDIASKEQFSPKVGLIYTPTTDTTLRAHFTRSLGDAFGESGLGLEPTTVGGLNQSFRNLFPEAIVGLVPASQMQTVAAGISQSLFGKTYLELQTSLLTSDADRVLGDFTNATFIRIPNSPSETLQRLQYREQNLMLNCDQIVDRDWIVGAHYRLSQAHLDGDFPEVPRDAVGASGALWNQTALLNQMNLFINFNHSSGFFSQFQSLWTGQWNQGYSSELADSFFWQHNIFAGYRFLKRRITVQVGVMNLTDQNYRLNPLNLYSELPRTRTFVAKLQFSF